MPSDWTFSKCDAKHARWFYWENSSAVDGGVDSGHCFRGSHSSPASPVDCVDRDFIDLRTCRSKKPNRPSFPYEGATSRVGWPTIAVRGPTMTSKTAKDRQQLLSHF